jgi:hypothetical protein
VAHRWPRIVAHLICHSLGYAMPSVAAAIVFDATRGRQNWCEWVFSCYGGDPVPALRRAITGRHGHRGYMAHFPAAKALVDEYVRSSREPEFASWF